MRRVCRPKQAKGCAARDAKSLHWVSLQIHKEPELSSRLETDLEHRLKQRYGTLLRETIADTIGPDEDPEAELAALMSAFD